MVKANPDAPQLPVRARAPAEGKLVYMAVPRLADARPFILLDPVRLDVPPRRAASISGSTRAGRRIGVAELRPVDLVLCGSVAVNRQGARVGKGGGFSDLEFALLAEAGLIGKDTMLAMVQPARAWTTGGGSGERRAPSDHPARAGPSAW